MINLKQLKQRDISSRLRLLVMIKTFALVYFKAVVIIVAILILLFGWIFDEYKLWYWLLLPASLYILWYGLAKDEIRWSKKFIGKMGEQKYFEIADIFELLAIIKIEGVYRPHLAEKLHKLYLMDVYWLDKSTYTAEYYKYFIENILKRIDEDRYHPQASKDGDEKGGYMPAFISLYYLEISKGDNMSFFVLGILHTMTEHRLLFDIMLSAPLSFESPHDWVVKFPNRKLIDRAWKGYIKTSRQEIRTMNLYV